MAGKMSGLKGALQATTAITDGITAIKIIRALKAAAYIIRPEATSMTPIDTSVLVNSQFDVIDVGRTRITSRIGYSANYAMFVHEASGKGKGLKRPSGNGNYWDVSGEPKFLEKAGERTKSLVDRAIRQEMKL